MNIPENVMEIFEKEAQNIKYGKITLGIIRRGSHEYYKIKKQISIQDNEKNTSLKMVADEDSKL